MMPDRKGAFPQGLVLGLTMAETAILIIFVLLLALAMLLSREADRRQAAEQDLKRFEEIQRILEERDVDAVGLLDRIRTNRRDRRDADNWRELVRDLGQRMADPSPAAIASRLDDAREALERDAANRAIGELLDESGLESTPETLSDLAAMLQAVAGLTADEVRDAIGVQQGLDDALGDGGGETGRRGIEDLVTDAERWRAMAGDARGDLVAVLDRANARIAQLEAQVGGRGTDHPSCWYDADNTVAYLFDVALTDEGFVLRLARAPQHRRKRAALPIDTVLTGRLLSRRQFLEQTRPVFEWSVAEDCRFFVRAFDLTAADRKELYKARMRTVESRFYKNASPSGPPPVADPSP